MPRYLDEVHLVLIELPKFKPRTIAEKMTGRAP